DTLALECVAHWVGNVGAPVCQRSRKINEGLLAVGLELAEQRGPLGHVWAPDRDTVTGPASVTLSEADAVLFPVGVLLVNLTADHQQHCDEPSFLKVPPVEQAQQAPVERGLGRPSEIVPDGARALTAEQRGAKVRAVGLFL